MKLLLALIALFYVWYGYTGLALLFILIAIAVKD